MLIKVNIPHKYLNWNLKYKSPYGTNRLKSNEILSLLPNSIISNTYFKAFFDGPFSFQNNSSTRIVEYPWAFFATELRPKMNVLDIGGGFGGFQFVLSKNGLDVTNVDPGDQENRWNYKETKFRQLNTVFRTNVKLIQKKIEDANFTESSFDRIFCISVLEHLDKKNRENIVNESYRILKKGGYLILTVDLFLDLYPFSDKKANKWGTNIDVYNLIKDTKFKLSQGNKEELCGFKEFKAKNILANLDKYLMGSSYPVLSQALVLQK